MNCSLLGVPLGLIQIYHSVPHIFGDARDIKTTPRQLQVLATCRQLDV